MKRKTRVLFISLLALALILLGGGIYRLMTACKPDPIGWIRGFEQSYVSLEGDSSGASASRLPEEVRFRMKIEQLDRRYLKLRGTVQARLRDGREETREDEALVLYEAAGAPHMIFGAMMTFNSDTRGFDSWNVFFTSDMKRLMIRVTEDPASGQPPEIRLYAADPEDSLADVESSFEPYLSELAKARQGS